MRGCGPTSSTDNLHLTPDLPIGVIGHAHPAWLGDAFKPGSHVDAVAEDIVVIDDDIADMDANTELNPFILWHKSILLNHAALDFDGPTHRIHGTGKLDQHAVARGFDDPASMGSDSGIDESLPDGLEPGQCSFLVDTH